MVWCWFLTKPTQNKRMSPSNQQVQTLRSGRLEQYQELSNCSWFFVILIIVLCVMSIPYYLDSTHFSEVETNCTKYRLEVRIAICPENYTNHWGVCLKCNEGVRTTEWMGVRTCDPMDSDWEYGYSAIPICEDDEEHYGMYCQKLKCSEGRIGPCTCRKVYTLRQWIEHVWFENEINNF